MISRQNPPMSDLADLNAPVARDRLAALHQLSLRGGSRGYPPPAPTYSADSAPTYSADSAPTYSADSAPTYSADSGGEVNCHVHTIYSFSPYSPSAAAARARASGLAAVGIMDHDSIAGAGEMREAGRVLGIATTAGVELRVSAAGTLLEGRKINNPDSTGVFYMMIHGVPARSVPRCAHSFSQSRPRGNGGIGAWWSG